MGKSKKRSQWKTIWMRFKKNKLAVCGLVMLLLMIVLALCANLLVDYQADAIEQNLALRLQPPGGEHIFGTDQYGRDIFARTIFGARISLFVGFATVIMSLAMGSVFGAAAGYYGGKIDNVIMRIMDIFLAIPSILLAISIVSALGPSLTNLLIAMSISQVPRFSRIVRSSILSFREQEFVEAAKSYGTGDARIIFRYIMPNAVGPIIVQATNNLAGTILSISSMSFIGLGIQPPTPEWGSMLADARQFMRYDPYLITIPGVAIILLVLSLTLIGDGLRDALDPRLKN